MELKIKKNAKTLPGEEPRNKWPFTDMDVGDVVEVENKDEWASAQKYALSAGGRKKWKMQTVWLGKIGRIRRLA